MTVTERTAPAPTATDGPGARRLIAVGIRGYGSDGSALRWALGELSLPADRLHLVHAYVPLRIEGCHWAPVAAERGARRERAQHVLGSALQRVRAASPDCPVEGSAVAGLPDDVLIEFSDVVDLLVVGEDEPGRHPVASALAARSRCPVVVVPSDFVEPAAGLPVTVLVDTLDLPSDLLESGWREAQRRHTALRVAHAWSSLAEERPWTAQLLANRQARLDAQLAEWLGVRPSDGTVGELLIDDGPDALADLRVHSQLVIVGPGAPRLLGRLDPARAGRCPVVVRPDVIRT